MGKWTNLQWVVQKNLTNSNDFSALEDACHKLQIPFVGIAIIPFSNQLPDFDWYTRAIFYGSTSLNRLAYENPRLRQGVFFDPSTFSIARYIKEWGKCMLNYGARIMTFQELLRTEFDPEKLLFIHPDDDGKSFAGEVLRFADCREWLENLRIAENPGISGDSKIIVGEPFQIGREWRLWCVDKKVIAASQYRQSFKLEKHRGCPPEVIVFAETRCREFTPHDVFVMDICESGGDLYIVECNCLNAAGFYDADIEAIVSGVTNYFSNRLPDLSHQDIVHLMTKCLLYKIRSNVRMITMKFNPDDLAKMKLCCYLDTTPEELDTELMEDAIALFIAQTSLIDTYIEVVVECRLGSWDEIYDGREILFARFEP